MSSPPCAACFNLGKRARLVGRVPTGARKRAGCPERTFHDYGRTAARNLVRAGIPATQAKEFPGHETLSVFDRYSIQDATSMQQAAAKYAASLKGGEANPPVPLTGKVRAK